jgi:hypothetical protein
VRRRGRAARGRPATPVLAGVAGGGVVEPLRDLAKRRRRRRVELAPSEVHEGVLPPDLRRAFPCLPLTAPLVLPRGREPCHPLSPPSVANSQTNFLHVLAERRLEVLSAFEPLVASESRCDTPLSGAGLRRHAPSADPRQAGR